MKSIPVTLVLVLLGAPIPIYAAQQLVPAGSLLECTMSEPKFSSKTAAIGDPVLCQLSMTAVDGPSVLPYNSYLEGRFEAYKDPGHFVGKGWMELTFNRMLIEPNTVIPIQTKVVNASGFNIDREGRILGRGHTVRDTVEWMIPVLWPIDLLTLPRRGPRPTLKSETELTLKVMNDFGVPMAQPLQRDRSGLLRRPTSYSAPPPAVAPAEPIQQTEVQPIQPPATEAEYAPEQQQYAEEPYQGNYACSPMNSCMGQRVQYTDESYRPEYVRPEPQSESYYPPRAWYYNSPPPRYYYSQPPVYYYPPAPVYYYPPPPQYVSPYGPVGY